MDFAAKWWFLYSKWWICTTGSALAVDTGAVTGDRAARIVAWFGEHWSEVVQDGQVKHLALGEHWAGHLFWEYDVYQNGGQFSMEESWFPIEECWFPIEECWFYIKKQDIGAHRPAGWTFFKLKTRKFVLKTRNFVLKTRNYVLKMLDFARCCLWLRGTAAPWQSSLWGMRSTTVGGTASTSGTTTTTAATAMARWSRLPGSSNWKKDGFCLLVKRWIST